jgi:hypothetical protein
MDILNEISEMRLKNNPAKQAKKPASSPYAPNLSSTKLPKVALEDQIQVNSSVF